MTNYIAAVKDTYTGQIEIIERDCYPSKKKFAEELRYNGYKVRFISTKEKFDEDCEKYHERMQRQTLINKYVRQGRRQLKLKGIL